MLKPDSTRDGNTTQSIATDSASDGTDSGMIGMDGASASASSGSAGAGASMASEDAASSSQSETGSANTDDGSADTGTDGTTGQESSDDVPSMQDPANTGDGDPTGNEGSADDSNSDGTMVATMVAQDADCDLNGIWAGHQITVSEALTLPQSSNNWFYLELQQSGTDVVVTQHFDCGIEVRGSAEVSLARAGLEAQLTHNVQVGRKATMRKDGDVCEFAAERFWSIRGADEERFLPPGGRNSSESIQEVAAAVPLPTASMTDGAIDPDGDGKLGLAFQVSGLIAGTRNSVQRDWGRWFTEPGYEITPSEDWSTDLVVRADFDNEENVLDPADGLLTSGSTPRARSKHELRLRFLGRDASDPRASALVQPERVDTCYAIQDAMPPEELE